MDNTISNRFERLGPAQRLALFAMLAVAAFGVGALIGAATPAVRSTPPDANTGSVVQHPTHVEPVEPRGGQS